MRLLLEIGPEAGVALVAQAPHHQEAAVPVVIETPEKADGLVLLLVAADVRLALGEG